MIEIYLESDSEEVKKASSRSYFENAPFGVPIYLSEIGNKKIKAVKVNENKIFLDEWDYMEYYRGIYSSVDSILEYYPIISKSQGI